MIRVNAFKPKPKIKVEVRQAPQIVVILKKNDKLVGKERRRKKRLQCINCIDAKLIQSDGFNGKTQIYCYAWDTVVHGRQAKICSKFAPR